MTEQSQHLSRGYARIAGLLYLIIAVVGAFAIAYVPSQIIVAGDLGATGRALIENTGLFRLGLVGDTVVIIAEIVLTAMLYIMFRPIDRTVSMVAAFARLSMVMVMSVNLLIHAVPMALLGDIDPQVWEPLTGILLQAHQFGIYVWGILFGVHLLALGYLVTISGLYPRILGWAMAVGAFGYAIEGVAKITATDGQILSVVTVALLTIVTIGEISFALWLLVKGPKPPASASQGNR